MPLSVDHRRRVLNHIVININRFRHRPADITHVAAEAQAGAMAKGGVDRHGSWNLKQRQPQRPSEVFGDIQRLPAAQPDDAIAMRQIGDFLPFNSSPSIVETR